MMLTFKKPNTKKILIFPSGSEMNDSYLIKIFKKIVKFTMERIN